MHETPLGLIPYLTILDGKGDEALDFYQHALGAEVLMRNHGEDMPGDPMPGGRLIHARMRVGGQLIFLSDDFPEFRGGAVTPPPAAVTLHFQVDDVDMWWKRATEAGATVTFDLAEQFWGDRYGSVTDPYGHSWSFGQSIKR